MTYSERPAARPGVVLWQSRPVDAQSSLILPDGCLDLLWDGATLQVAGPDTVARLHAPGRPAGFTALRFAAATGPCALGVSAADVVDQLVPLRDIWGDVRTARLEEQVAAGGAPALEQWLRSAPEPSDPLGARVFGLARTGLPVGEIADHVGFSARQLQRRSQELFGYGAGHLVRVLRLQKALASARSGQPLSMVAADAGYYDQPHFSREIRALTGRTPTDLLR
ncbi:helix-turn-helix transcriptional regulator [Kineosporia sp. NBRC 101731]|uniref:helix-turn-helix transcriptional regulator n=1 Tax=Kineosporia sp. NBRC 101731 TaxID=3032199 RepID=UPI0024A250D9|nr:helix-turn-helix transcriptional regulator [Kineosporia sp. NBRC 101731]GLY33100.1 AraC family transcriptional regulator [Kineosporia sp. NBRC 101731]